MEKKKKKQPINKENPLETKAAGGNPKLVGPNRPST
ncbi:hypothetical protein J2S13_000049 [Oikeobacillus pervagus]|uniref:Uncharacterized protein n=1 Tax=Oikeobacillus pervagus TaxID=1325931 RepID=A0AAJ1SVK3_9BACI|nr:hypothetical protein [Oikeobacillus pervagus]